MSGNFGIGIGAFANGFVGGMGIGRQLVGAFQDGELDKIRSQGLAEAKTQRAQAVQAQQGITATGDGLGADDKIQYTAGGKTFDSEAEAGKAADAKVAPLSDFIAKTMIPKLADAYVGQGRVEEAAALTKWSDDKKVQQGFRSYAGMLHAEQNQDPEMFAQHFTELNNNNDYMPNGFKVLKSSVEKDKDGNFTGITLEAENEKTGAKFTQTYGADQVYQIGLGVGAPQTAAANFLRDYAARRADAAELAKEGREQARDIAKIDRKGQWDERAEGTRHANDLARDNHKAALDTGTQTAVFEKKANFLRGQGYDEAFIKANAPEIVGINRGDDPSRLRARMHEARMASDYNYKTLDAVAQRALIDRDMAVTAAQDAAPAGKTAVLDRKAGQIVFK